MLDRSPCPATINGYAVLLAKIGFEQKLLQLPRRVSIPLNVIKTRRFYATCGLTESHVSAGQGNSAPLGCHQELCSASLYLHTATNIFPKSPYVTRPHHPIPPRFGTRNSKSQGNRRSPDWSATRRQSPASPLPRICLADRRKEACVTERPALHLLGGTCVGQLG